MIVSNLSSQSNSHARYPIEPSFLRHVALATLTIFLPSMLLCLFGGHRFTGRAFQMFFGHWVCPLILWFFGASLSYLLAKMRMLRAEELHTRLLKDEVLPRALDGAGTASASDLYGQMQSRLRNLVAARIDNNLLLVRLRGVLLHGLGPEDVGLAGEVDRHLLASSFALPRYTVWAIPMWGLIGTVLGISEAVARFSDSMQSIQSAGGVTETLQNNLPLVTKGLASAFDATFVALLLSLPVMLLITWVEKYEEHYLSNIDETWQQEILPQISAYAVPNSPSQPVVASLPASSSTPVGEELHTLSLQVLALKETVADLHEGLSRAAQMRQA